MMGKTRIVVKDDKIIEVGEPEIEWCPLIAKLSGIQKITSEEVERNVEYKIREYGMFTAKRQLLGHDTYVAFGASEIMMSGLRSGFLETTVTACDGAGTVISNNPELVQGIGGRMSGLVETEPIEDVITGIQRLGGKVLNPSTATIDPVKGVRKSSELGYRKIVVTIANSQTAKKLRELAKPLVQAAAAIPLFALTKKGKELVIEREKDIESPILITIIELPVVPKHKQPWKLK